MEDLICPFSATLVKDDFACKLASRIIRRGGSEIACSATGAHARCVAMFQHLKDTALPEFGVEDDLLQVPHGVLLKIQFGGLLGLQRLAQAAVPTATAIHDIDALLETALATWGSIDNVPYSQLSEDMTGYKLARRGGRK